jgi:hypothetical protein
MAPQINVAIDTPASKIKLFIFVIVVIGTLAVASFFLIQRSRRTEPPPKSPTSTPMTYLDDPVVR